MPTKTSSNNVQALAQTIAKQIIERGDDGPLVLSSGLTGSFTLAIKYETTTYELTVTIPDTEGGEYVFSLTETPSGGKAADLASFKYKDQSNWQVAVGLPAAITFGGITIETLQLKLGEGTVTA
jgi:hypothetical protein